MDTKRFHRSRRQSGQRGVRAARALFSPRRWPSCHAGVRVVATLPLVSQRAGAAVGSAWIRQRRRRGRAPICDRRRCWPPCTRSRRNSAGSGIGANEARVTRSRSAGLRRVGDRRRRRAGPAASAPALRAPSCCCRWPNWRPTGGTRCRPDRRRAAGRVAAEPQIAAAVAGRLAPRRRHRRAIGVLALLPAEGTAYIETEVTTSATEEDDRWHALPSKTASCRVPNRFELVMLAAQRARNLGAGAPLTVERDDDKNPVIALREIADGTVDLDELESVADPWPAEDGRERRAGERRTRCARHAAADRALAGEDGDDEAVEETGCRTKPRGRPTKSRTLEDDLRIAERRAAKTSDGTGADRRRGGRVGRRRGRSSTAVIADAAAVSRTSDARRHDPAVRTGRAGQGLRSRRPTRTRSTAATSSR